MQSYHPYRSGSNYDSDFNMFNPAYQPRMVETFAADCTQRCTAAYPGHDPESMANWKVCNSKCQSAWNKAAPGGSTGAGGLQDVNRRTSGVAPVVTDPVSTTTPAYTTTPVYTTTPAYTPTPVYTTTPAYTTTPVYTTTPPATSTSACIEAKYSASSESCVLPAGGTTTCALCNPENTTCEGTDLREAGLDGDTVICVPNRDLPHDADDAGGMPEIRNPG